MEASNGTLADEFMLDFEDGEDADAGEQEAEEAVAHQAVLTDLTVLPSNLRTTPRFETVMQEMEREAANEGVNADSFALISKANELAADVVEHQLRVSKYVKDLYQERFPELASLVLDNLEYVKTVMVIGNEMDITKVQSGLDEVLPGHMSMIVRIGASTSDGREMGEEKLLAVMRGCNEYIELEVARKKILAFIQSKMSHVAPNLSELVGTEVAALLVTAAGGLDQLSKLHANAIRVLGIQGKKDLMGLSTKTQIQHVGYLLQCDLLKNCASSVRTQAIRTLAGRVALAARVDANAGPGKGGVTVGREYKEEVQAKIEKLLAPLPPRQIKALPVPKTGEGKTVKRGGEQARRKKAKTKMTELRKQQNRLAFGEVKEEGLHDLMGGDLGMVGTAMGTGKVKVAVEDTGILKGISKKRKLEIAKALEPGQGSRTSFGRASHLQMQGQKSSLALEGDRGIELVEKAAPSSIVPGAASLSNKYFGNSFFAAPAPKK